LGLGLALPFVAVAFIPALRDRLPKPGSWMVKLQRILAIPMALTAAGCLWLLWRMGGGMPLRVGIVATLAVIFMLAGAGVMQRKGRQTGYVATLVAIAVAVIAVAFMPPPSTEQSHAVAGAEPWSEEAVAMEMKNGQPAFVYFTADWCLTCKANEAGAINREAVQDAFNAAGVRVLAGDWTNGDPEITRFLESRGRAGVPLYLWYEPGREVEELPQILTPSMLIDRAQRPRR
jgi:thiol:disulfide interchange protein